MDLKACRLRTLSSPPPRTILKALNPRCRPTTSTKGTGRSPPLNINYLLISPSYTMPAIRQKGGVSKSVTKSKGPSHGQHSKASTTTTLGSSALRREREEATRQYELNLSGAHWLFCIFIYVGSPSLGLDQDSRRILEEGNGTTIDGEPYNDEMSVTVDAHEQEENLEASSLQETAFTHALRDLVTSR